MKRVFFFYTNQSYIKLMQNSKTEIPLVMFFFINIHFLAGAVLFIKAQPAEMVESRSECMLLF